jgi:hypothetical protein
MANGQPYSLRTSSIVSRCTCLPTFPIRHRNRRPINWERRYDFILSRVLDLERQLSTTKALPLIHAHRLVTNVIAAPAHCSTEFAVTSYVLITYARENENEGQLLTVERRDCLRRAAGSFHIARSEVRIGRIPAEMRPSVGFL